MKPYWIVVIAFLIGVCQSADLQAQSKEKEGSAAKSDSAAAAQAPASAGSDSKSTAEAWATLTGQIVVDGEVPAQPAENVAGNPHRAFCVVDGKVPADDGLVVGKDNALRDVFVYISPKSKKTEVPVHESYEALKKQPVVLDNVKCRFVPHAAFVRPGQKLIVKNSDTVGHNCNIKGLKNGHNINIGANDQAELTMAKSEVVPSEVGCDYHPWMDSVLFIRDNPYVAITDADGKFTMKNVPEGEWEFRFWHKKAGYMKDLEIADVKVDRKGRAKVEMKKGASVDLGTMKFPVKSFK